MKQSWKILICAGIMVLAMSMSAFAAQWQQNEYGWWYQQDDGSYIAGRWEWIDGNQDGIAECYYFNEYGYCVIGTAPDGYTTDSNGAWTINGVVQTRPVAIEASSDTILGSYTGSYNASQGKTGVDLIFFEEDDELKAEFIFYNLPDQTNAKNGSYLCKVEKIDAATYEIIADQWLDHPSGYDMLSWQLTLNTTRKQLTGTCLSNSSYKISVKKKRS